MKPVKPKPFSTFKSTVSFLYGLMLLAGMLGCGTLNPLSPATPTPTASGTPTATITPTPTPTPTLPPTPTEIPVLCGGPRAMFILLVGSDARRDTYDVGLADSMRLVRVDFVEPSLRVLAFPRDLYVEIPGIADHGGITHGKLNQAFLYGNPGYNYYDGPGQGPGLLARTLEHNFDAQVDHYVAVNLQTFVRIIDTLGGIDVNLPYVIDGRVRDSRDPNRYFAAGPQRLDGYRTMLLARLRPGGDLQRLEIQNLILRALADQLLSPVTILKFPQLIRSFDESIQTDLNPTVIRRLLCLRRKLDTEKIEFLNFPEGLFESARVRDPVLGNTSILNADFEVLADYVKKFSDGAWRRPEVPTREEITP
jgi:LCP family protein required for cell wall assembly